MEITPEFLTQLGEMVSLIVVFLAFFFVLKKFAWKPLIETVDERQREIESSFEEVKKLQDDAKESHARYEVKLKEIEEEARVMIEKRVKEAELIAQTIKEEAKREGDNIREKAREGVQLELANARKQLREDVISLTIQATERLIREKMDEARDRELVGSFIEELETKSL